MEKTLLIKHVTTQGASCRLFARIVHFCVVAFALIIFVLPHFTKEDCDASTFYVNYHFYRPKASSRNRISLVGINFFSWQTKANRNASYQQSNARHFSLATRSTTKNFFVRLLRHFLVVELLFRYPLSFPSTLKSFLPCEKGQFCD
jgi:hypothetical protein